MRVKSRSFFKCYNIINKLPNSISFKINSKALKRSNNGLKNFYFFSKITVIFSYKQKHENI